MAGSGPLRIASLALALAAAAASLPLAARGSNSTQCFRPEAIQAKCSDPWRDEDLGQAAGLTVSAAKGSQRFEFGERRAISLTGCQAVQRLISNHHSHTICVEWMGPLEREKDGVVSALLERVWVPGTRFCRLWWGGRC